MNVDIVPLPFGLTCRCDHSYLGEVQSASYTALLTCKQPGSPVLSIRDEVFMVSPKRQ